MTRLSQNDTVNSTLPPETIAVVEENNQTQLLAFVAGQIVLAFGGFMAYRTSVGAYVDVVSEALGSSLLASLALSLIGFYDLPWVANWANIRYAGLGAALTALIGAKWSSGSLLTYLTYFSVVPAAAVTFWTLTSEGTYDDFVASE